MQDADQTGKFQFNPLFNPQFKRHNQPQNKPPSQFQHNSPQYQWQNYPTNHNLTSFNPEQKQNHNKLQNNYQNNYQKQYNQKYASTPKVINKRVKFTPNVNTTKATTPKFFKSYNQQPCNQQYNQYNQHNQQYNEANMTPKSTDHGMCSPKFKFHTLQYGQQWTCNGISQARPYSEPILSHSQSLNSPKQVQYDQHHTYNKYMPKAKEEIQHSTIAHMYTMSAHFENNILSVEVYDSIQGNKFRNEFGQNDFPLYPIYNIAKILVDAINSSKAGRNSISINGFKPISISEYGQWCYLTVNGTQIPSFALRPTY